VIAVARYLKEKYRKPVHLEGRHAGAVLAGYAALLEPDVESLNITIHEDFSSHMKAKAPQFLNVLRVCDVPEILGMLAPKQLTLSAPTIVSDKVRATYVSAGADGGLTITKP
jgi:hypothetical protein